jgi:hypothetical protein
MSDAFAYAVSERSITEHRVITVQDGALGSDGPAAADHRWLRGNGQLTLQADTLTAQFSGAAGSYDLRLMVPQPLDAANGLSVCYRISGWQTIRYLAIGHTAADGFRHVKIHNPVQDEWVTFSVGYADLAYLLANDWQQPAAGPIGDVRLYLSGTPAGSAAIAVSWAAVWHETETLLPEPQAVPAELGPLLQRYFREYNQEIEEHAEAYLQRGVIPMMGRVTLPWALDEAVPAAIVDSPTYRYLWHSLRPAMTLLVYGDERGAPGALAAARELITAWFDRSYYQTDPDSKYAWYDHGTADRLKALVLMYRLGQQLGYDRRFMTRLRSVMLRHGQLLESEAFYCKHQHTRYHNHGWFQDIALIAVAVAVPELPCAARWIARAQQRLADQFRHLVVQDGPFAISIENSIGYHLALLSLADVAAQLLALRGAGAAVAQMVQQLRGWADFLRYPDERRPSQGDSTRRPNPRGPAGLLVSGAAYQAPTVTVLPQAGYAVLQGNHDGRPFMCCLFATAHSVTHKHEDDLALTLFYDGIEWLIDPSFYSHDYAQPIPAFLRSARAHSRPVVTDRPHRLLPGQARVLPPQGDGSIRAESDAYAGLRLTRTLQCAPDSLQIAVRDTVHGAVAAGSFAVMLHCGEGVTPHLAGLQLLLTHRCTSAALVIDLPAHAVVTSVRGPLEGAPEQGIAGAGYRDFNTTTLVKIAVDGPAADWCIRAVRSAERSHP